MESFKGQYEPNELTRCLDNEAKWYWGASLSAGAGIFVIGVVATFIPTLSTVSAYGAAGLTMVSFYWNYKSDNSRSKAQELRRKIDLFDSFGWGLNVDDYNDLVLRCSKWVKKRAGGKVPSTPYFESCEPIGAKRALENVRESAWWSEHLSEKMFYLLFWTSLSLVLMALASLILTLATVQSEFTKDLSIYSKIARSVTSLLMLLFSLNLIKLTMSYYKFCKGAAKCKNSAIAQLKQSPKNKDEAIIKLYEYFIVRSGSPILPTWIWKRNRDELNDLYPFKSEFHADNEAVPEQI